jgi:hypothetical protein
VNSGKFVSSNFHGVLLGEVKTTAIMEYYGNFTKIADDYSAYGQRPNIFNITYIKLEHAEVVYLNQLALQRQASFGFDINMNDFMNSTDFAWVHSNGYSTVFYRKDPTPPTLP